MLKAKITDIKKFAVHDGDGLRTTVFFKGCPLKCIWCHNPEGISPLAQTAYFAGKCINCGGCAKICDANSIEDLKHIYKRSLCTNCARCESVCPSGSFRVYAREYSIREIFDIIMEDKDFYDVSNGGVTLSGGECLLQSEFCTELLKMCCEHGINTAVDTCGYVPEAALESVHPYTDTFLYDIKAIDEDVHIKCTGHSNRLILDNLMYLNSTGKKTEIRYPFVPGLNSNQAEKIADFLKDLKSITGVKILPFHNLSNSRYLALGMEDTVPDIPIPTAEELKKVYTIFEKRGIKILMD